MYFFDLSDPRQQTDKIVLVISLPEAEVVQLIFKLYLDGTSIVGIRKELEQRNIPSPTGKSVWCSGTIDKMLSNEKYAGCDRL